MLDFLSALLAALFSASGLAGFIAGLLGSAVIGGVRPIVASRVVGRKIRAGKLRRSEEDPHFFEWYVEIEVAAHPLWHLLASDLQDVQAVVKFRQRNGNEQVQRASWMQGDIDTMSTTLRVDGKYRLRIGIEPVASPGLRPGSDPSSERIVSGSRDILLRIDAAQATIALYLFENAIAYGQVFETVPRRIGPVDW